MAQGGSRPGSEASERHQAEAAKLRGEIEELVKKARILLHGEPGAAARPSAPRQPHPRRAERDSQLEQALEKADWFRREIKRMRQELENRDHLSGGPADPRDRDPMELYNLLAEKRRELQVVQRSVEGFDRAVEAQQKADDAHKALRPDVKDRLEKVRDEVEAQKRLHVKLMAERLRLSNARKTIEDELRNAGKQLRNKAAVLHKPSPGKSSGDKPDEQAVIKQLRRDIDILKSAVKQDERRHRAALKEDSQEVDFAAAHVQGLLKSIEEREAEVARLSGAVDGQLHMNWPAQEYARPQGNAVQGGGISENLPTEEDDAMEFTHKPK
eukprot:TRINITY_DN31892_c0_g1_i1.p1 TRINITY_DN31892_c0_g1~~TRINITY_DN31892_c0_g1_i1.p1  ORF type:complete len:384 (+),score=82.55 TRINITY_DN31892_c0_g1_i1:173-1153(+)